MTLFTKHFFPICVGLLIIRIVMARAIVPYLWSSGRLIPRRWNKRRWKCQLRFVIAFLEESESHNSWGFLHFSWYFWCPYWMFPVSRSGWALPFSPRPNNFMDFDSRTAFIVFTFAMSLKYDKVRDFSIYESTRNAVFFKKTFIGLTKHSWLGDLRSEHHQLYLSACTAFAAEATSRPAWVDSVSTLPRCVFVRGSFWFLGCQKPEQYKQKKR